ncbi:MAG: MFS transporter [Anaerolineae bacterium]|nr:MFS transporter [Anaerolineae bacterium]
MLFATILASSMAFIDGSALNVALPALQVDLGATGAQLLWIVNGYLLMLASLILVGGSLGDRFGRKRVFGVGIAVFAGASFACGLAPTAEIMILARVVQGLGGALMVPGSLAIISATFGPDRRGQAIGTWSAFTTITTVIGPLLGGELASRGLWRGVFFINLPLAVLALVALYGKVPESRDDEAPARLDYPGALLVTFGLAGVTYGFIEAPARGLADPQILVALVGGVIALVAFVIVEARSRCPMVPLELFRSRTFSGANLLTLFLYAALNVIFFFLPLNMVQVQGYSEAMAGRALLPFAILLTLLSRWAGGLVDRYGPRLPLVAGPAITGIGFFVLAFPGLTSGPDSFWTTYLPAIAVIGVGMGITVAPLTTAVMGSVPQKRAGIASGINNAVARTAGVLAIAVTGAIFLSAFSASLMAYTDDVAMSEQTRAALQSEAANMGNAAPPPGLAEDAQAAVEGAIRLAFVDTFNLIMYIAAALAWLSALMAALLIEPRITEPARQPALSCSTQAPQG